MVEISLFSNEPTRRSVADGDYLFRAGDPGHHMYGVIEGAIDIVVEGTVVDTVQAGGILGEMAVLADDVRTADARAAGDTVVAEIDQKRFLTLVKINPFFAIQVMRILSDRLRQTNKQAWATSD